jgi:hypothetical protein
MHLRDKHIRAAMEPLCSDAARLNPNCRPEELWQPGALQAEDKLLIDRIVKHTQPEIIPDTITHLEAPERRGADFAKLMAHADTTSYSVQSGAASVQQMRECVKRQLLKYTSVSKTQRQQSMKRVDVLDYWREHKSQWPNLAAYALHLNTRPITSSATERHFSRTVDIEGTDRLRLSSEHVQDLALLQANVEIADDLIVKSA